LLEEESKHDKPKEAMESSMNMVLALLDEKGVTYDELIQSLS